ncbi:MAG: 23S rRNA (pseudouridine(1915)-N(3))-methyltransferase RlmH [Lachnospiraceae bacterium]|nr:23S rRNA (pseudouridine(1915)-N(3))-methyltransferase RlmH [Lachnospiraceae bacterium]
MNKIKILVVGSVKEEFLRNKINELRRKIEKCGKYKVEIIEVPDESIPENASETVIEKIKNIEGKKLLSKIEAKDYVIALCIDGKSTTNEDMNRLMYRAFSNYCTSVVYVIGGSLGLSDETVKRADYRLSFSNMTFPHQLMRVILLEAISDVCRKA